MGINGLLLNLRSISRKQHISVFAGQKVAIDGYSWLHRALHLCGVDVAVHNDLGKIVSYFEKKIAYFLSVNMKVTLVFDGDKLPLKISTETSRLQNRQKCHASAMELFEKGKFEDANKLFTQAIDISPAMACFVKTQLESIFGERLAFLVAPYEADSQLAYLSKVGLADIIVTEDSDLLVFGAARMLYKLDKDFNGFEVSLSRLNECAEFSFEGWSHDKFIFFCIVSGCDYLESPRGIGIKKAYTLVAKANGPESLFSELGDRVASDYPSRFHAAFLAFKYQRVYCPIKQKIVSLSEFSPQDNSAQNALDYQAFQACLQHFGNLEFLGKVYKPEVAQKIAKCELDPISKEPFPDNYDNLFNCKKKPLKQKKIKNGLYGQSMNKRANHHSEKSKEDPAIFDLKLGISEEFPKLIGPDRIKNDWENQIVRGFTSRSESEIKAEIAVDSMINRFREELKSKSADLFALLQNFNHHFTHG